MHLLRSRFAVKTQVRRGVTVASEGRVRDACLRGIARHAGAACVERATGIYTASRRPRRSRAFFPGARGDIRGALRSMLARSGVNASASQRPPAETFTSVQSPFFSRFFLPFYLFILFFNFIYPRRELDAS